MSKTRYGRSGELRIAYELRGRMRRRPWLVLIQGMGLDRFGWEPVLRKLRRRFRLVLVDNRASGLSGRPVGVFAVADMAADIVAVLDAAGIRRAHVMGASLGGMVAQELAVDHPERVDGLVLACTTPGWPSAYPMPQASMRLIAATAGMTAELALRRHTENALSARTVQHRPELVGRLVELQGSRPLGHLLFWEDPDGFADVVTSFLLGGRAGQQAPAGRCARHGARHRTGHTHPPPVLARRGRNPGDRRAGPTLTERIRGHPPARHAAAH